MSTVLQPLILLEIVFMSLLGFLCCFADGTIKEKIKWWVMMMGFLNLVMLVSLIIYFFLPWYLSLDF